MSHIVFTFYKKENSILLDLSSVKLMHKFNKKYLEKRTSHVISSSPACEL